MADVKGKVLCVDDEPHILRALQWLLKKDFEVATATSATEALRLLQRDDFDVVISDQRMPGVTGVEFLREVRKLAPRAVRILLTGYAELDAMVRSVNESEVFRFITKPWDVKTLPQLIGEAVTIARTSNPVPLESLDFTASSVAASGIGSDPAKAAAALGQVAEAEASDWQRKILVIDEDEEIHRAVDEAFGGHTVLHCYTLTDAIRYLEEQPVGVIVSDFRVGKVDVTRLIRMLKANHPEIIGVVFSAVQDAEYVVKLINEGQVYRILPKPLKPGFVKLVVGSALKRHMQLLQHPELVQRFKVDTVSTETAQSLLRDLERSFAEPAPAPAVPPAPTVKTAPQQMPAASESPHGGDHLLDRLKNGFRKLFHFG